MTKPNTAWTPEEGARLRQRRIDLGYSQAEIARRLGIGAEYLSGIEHGHDRGRPSRDLQQRLTDLLDRLGPKPCKRPSWGGRQAFRARRLELGFSAKRTADIVGVGRALLARWENGRTTPTVRQQRELARVIRRLESAPPDLHMPTGVRQPKANTEWHRTLRERRLAVGLSQAALAVRTGMNATTVCSYELGKKKAATFQAARIDTIIERERAWLATPRLRVV